MRTFDQYCCYALREEGEYVARDEDKITAALAECLDEVDVYGHGLGDEGLDIFMFQDSRSAVTANVGSKRALACKILRSPVKQAIKLFSSASSSSIKCCLLASDFDLPQSPETTEKHFPSESDWFVVPSIVPLVMNHSEPLDLSGTVTLDAATSTIGGSYGDVWKGLWASGNKLIPHPEIQVAIKAIRMRSDLEDYQRKLDKVRGAIYLEHVSGHSHTIAEIEARTTGMAPA
ncbi:hypothetical protein HWV62_11664 [Athelia sp. TMB]|nr:hypothetical protein HWV62_11664 [Athelia sp. TMB]